MLSRLFKIFYFSWSRKLSNKTQKKGKKLSLFERNLMVIHLDDYNSLYPARQLTIKSLNSESIPNP